MTQNTESPHALTGHFFSRLWSGRSLHLAVAVLAVAGMVIGSGLASAQAVPSGYQEYFVLGHEQHVWDMMNKVNLGESGPVLVEGSNSLVTATANADLQVIYYDHWEDGYEADIFNPIQDSTLILGDDDPSNGDACDFTLDTCTADLLNRGSYVNLASNDGLAVDGDPSTYCSITSATPGTYDRLCNTVPINDRCAVQGACTDSEIRFDGGDLIRSTGGPLSVVHTQDPDSQYIGGSTEILAREAVNNAFAYSIPIGEDLYDGGTTAFYTPFHYVDLNIVAYEDDTSVLVVSPGAGTVSFILDRGEHWSSLGYIDDGAQDTSLALTINAGTKVSTTKPISGLLFTGGDDTWATRHFALIPDVLHTTDYITTAAGANDRVSAVYIFNPDPIPSIDVTITDSSGTTVITVPPNSTEPYQIPAGSTVRMTSDRTFWGITAYDNATANSDWGHSWLATRFLTTNYTVSYAPGSFDDTENFSPVYLSPTLDNTTVLVDFDNDGLFDEVDTDGDGNADTGAADTSCDPTTPNCLYTVNTLSSLSIFDHTDFDNTGTRVVTNKPVALAWGQEIDLAAGGGVGIDTGFTVYPPLFVDPVLEIEKTVDPPILSTAGGVATYTVVVNSGDFEGLNPLTSLEVYDLLPPGIVDTDYVPGSTLITYPNLVQDPTDPVAVEDPPSSGRWRLDWTLSPTELEANRELIITYQIDIPAAPGGTPRSLTNEARASGTLGNSKFQPFDTAVVTQSDVSITKSVNQSSAQVGDVLTYTLSVSNNGLAAETNPVITDAIPAFATYCDSTTLPLGTCSDPTLGGVYVPSQNSVEWTAASLPVGGPTDLQFQAIVNDGTPVGTLVDNVATYESDQSPYFPSNHVVTEIVGPELAAEKSGPAGPLHPGEIATFEIVVTNISAVAATNVLIIDPYYPNATYVTESMEWRANTDPFVSVTDATGDDEGEINTTPDPDRLELLIPILPAGEDITFRFKVQVDSGTDGLFVNNQANVLSDQTLAIDTNLVQIPIVGDAEVTGHLFVDLDGDGIQDLEDLDLANVDVVITDSDGNTQIVSTDANGDYIATVVPGSTTVAVDENDPDFPPGAVVTTAGSGGTSSQVITAVSGSSVSATDVGFQPRSMTLTKDSDAVGHLVLPGQVIQYTISAVNESGINQDNVLISDPLPTGTVAVPGSTVVTYTRPVFRVTEYSIASTAFTGSSHDLTLDHDLATNYFAIVQGADGDGSDNNNTGPDVNFAAVTADPHATGELADSLATNRLVLTRNGNTYGWQGVVTVVECLRDCSSEGFVLRDARLVDHSGSATTGAETTANPWTDINQVMLLGGFNGAGCETPETDNAETSVCYARIYPSSTDQINWTRDDTDVTLTDATSTVMVLEWGSNWTVQRERIQGNNGGDGAATTGDYNTATLSTGVDPAHTWVWGTGHTDTSGIGEAGEAILLTLGNGVSQGATETLVAAGAEYANLGIDFEVYALTHTGLATDYNFKADGDVDELTVNVATAAAGAERMAFSTNGLNGNGNAYPRPMFSARYTSSSNIQLERRRSGQNFPAWVQGIDFSGIAAETTITGGDPADLVDAADNIDLGPGGMITVTFDVQVDPTLAAGITTITNTATMNTDQSGPFEASITDDVVRPSVMVEPNNGNYVVYDPINPQTRTYSHVVTNNGNVADSYAISAMSEFGAANPGAGWIVELIDPSTGTVIATDTDFSDGTWDGGIAVNTGTLAAGEDLAYDVRVTVPAGTPIGTSETTTLTASSNSFSSVEAFATDETVVADQEGPIVLVSDQSGIVSAGDQVVYNHTIFNNTGLTDTFDLSAYPTEPGWTSTVYNDSNGDGLYTPGIDVEISNTLQLADGESQMFFVVVEAPPGALPGDTDVTNITAVSRNNTALFDGVTDTTTVDPASTHDLSGGGTLLVSPGADCVGTNGCATFPGTIKSLSSDADVFDFTITASPFHDLDGLDHPTQLWIDTDADGIADTQIAEDVDGDGTWDTIAGGFDTNGDGEPDVAVAAGNELAYELRRPVDAAQAAYRDPVTLTAISQNTGEQDSITATNLLDAPTHAMITKFQPALAGGTVVIEWQTGEEIGTAGFRLERRRQGQTLQATHRGILPALGNTAVGGTYRFVDNGAAVGQTVTYVLWEVEVTGKSHILTVVDVEINNNTLPADTRGLPDNGYSVENRKAVLSRTPSDNLPPTPVDRSPGDEISRLRVRFEDEGLYFVSATSIADGLEQSLSTVQSWIGSGGLVLHTGDPGFAQVCENEPLMPGGVFADGFENGNFCAWSIPDDSSIGETIGWLAAQDNNGIYFYGRSIESIYTDEMVYWIEEGAGVRVASAEAGNPTPVEGQVFTETRLFEEEGPYPLTSVIEDPDSDFWFWDYVNVNPDFGLTKDTMTVEFEAPGRTSESVPSSMTVFLQAESSDDQIAMDHQVEVRLNGTLIGSDTWDGSTAHEMTLSFSQNLLIDGTNTLEIKAPAASGITSEIFYLDSFVLTYQRAQSAADDHLVSHTHGQSAVTIDHFTRPDISVFDISEPLRPTLITNPLIDSNVSGYRVTFDTYQGETFLAQPLETAMTPVIEADYSSSLRSPTNRSQHLVITGAGLEDEAQRLVDYRRSTGMSSMVVRIQDVYDEFSQGVIDPEAIRDFLSLALADWAVPPAYVVVVGDSSFDFKDNLGFGGNMVLSPMVSTPEGLFPSDHRLADIVGNDGIPEVAIGRIPARTPEQLAAYINKLRNFEHSTDAWKSRSAWVADAIDEGGEFILDTEDLINVAPSDIRTDRIYVDTLGQDDARTALLDSINEGTLLIHFLGHANMHQMGDDSGLLRSADIADLVNAEKQGILTAMTCSLGRFDRVVFDTIGESLLVQDGGGVTAVWAPTGLSFNRDGVDLSSFFTPAALNGTRLGDAILQALQSYLQTSGDPQEHMPYLYTLLGDPATRVNR